MKALYLSGSMFRDARVNAGALREQLLELGIINGPRAVLAQHEIGSVEVGKKADLVLSD